MTESEEVLVALGLHACLVCLPEWFDNRFRTSEGWDTKSGKDQETCQNKRTMNENLKQAQKQHKETQVRTQTKNMITTRRILTIKT